MTMVNSGLKGLSSHLWSLLSGSIATALQSQTEVTAHLKSQLSLLFDFDQQTTLLQIQIAVTGYFSSKRLLLLAFYLTDYKTVVLY